MCIACEQDAMWFAYLRRKGLITADGYLVEPPPSLAEPVDVPVADQKEGSANEAAGQPKVTGDDPAAQ